jgi:glyoxylase-like metal-dependent hydrolase (beta-lactamase superfamily II)
MLPESVELAPGVHRWVAVHPEWKREVASVAVETADGLVLVDPLAPATLRLARAFWKALDDRIRGGAPLHVILTTHYHERSTAALVGRYGRSPGVIVWAPQAAVPRIAARVDRPFAAGDVLVGGIEAYATGVADEVVLWLPEQRALVSGDALLGGVRKPYRVCPASWLPGRITRAAVATALRPLGDLPVELLVPTHGPAVTADAGLALRSALDEAGVARAAAGGSRASG